MSYKDRRIYPQYNLPKHESFINGRLNIVPKDNNNPTMIWPTKPQLDELRIEAGLLPLTEEQWEAMKDKDGNVFITDEKK